MRTPKLIVFSAFSAMLVFAGCKKDQAPILPLSAITIVNAMPTSNAFVAMFGSTTGQHFNDLAQVYYQSGQQYAYPPSTNAVLIRPITDTAFTMFQGSLPLVAGGIYSFFLAGDTTKPDTVLIKDNLLNIQDSSVGFRFVNLAVGGKAISINLAGNDPTTNTEVSSLGYLQYTSFKKYLADNTVPGSYTFEIHDKVSGYLLTTFDWYYTVSKNQTMVISGSTDPTSPLGLSVFTVNNF